MLQPESGRAQALEVVERDSLTGVEMKSRIMYVEYKGGGLDGPALITRVTFSKSGRSVYFDGKRLLSLAGRGYKANYFDVERGEEYWVSGCKKNGGDRLYHGVVEIDDAVREEYWVKIRAQPECRQEKQYRC